MGIVDIVKQGTQLAPVEIQVQQYPLRAMQLQERNDFIPIIGTTDQLYFRGVIEQSL
jgi:hypothetical protein